MTPELLARVGEAALSTVPESVQDDIPSELMTRAGDLTTVRSYWLDYRPCTPEAANRLEQVTLNSEMEVVDSSSTPLTPQVPISAEHTAPELEEYALGFVRRSYFLQSRPCVAEVADVCVERLSLRFGEGLVPKSVSRTATMPPLRAATPADMKASNYETEAATASDAPALYDGLLANAEELLTSGATVEQIREDRGVKLLYMGWRENALGEDMTPERAARTQRILSALGL